MRKTFWYGIRVNSETIAYEIIYIKLAQKYWLPTRCWID